MTSDRSSPPVVVGVALRDDDQAPLALARDLARFTGAPLALVHVDPTELPSRVPTGALQAERREHALQALRRAAEPFQGVLDVALYAEVSTSPVRGLHDAAAALDATLLVVGSSHRGPLGRVMPGGVGERLLHAAPCAIALAPRGYTGAEGGIRRIGVAFLDTPEGREALAAGAAMATLGDASLLTFTVLEPPHVGPAATPGWVPDAPDDARPRLRAAEERIRACMPGGVDTETSVMEGDPVELLAAASAGVDLLVCGSRGYGPLRTVLLGGVSGRLAHTAASPLLVLPRAHTPVAAAAGAEDTG
jgi:nucleotide-binding universal stress UspA family protein